MATSNTESTSLAIGVGFPTRTASGKILEVFYALVCFQPEAKLADPFYKATKHSTGNHSYTLSAADVAKIAQEIGHDGSKSNLLKQIASSKREILVTILGADELPTSTEEIYLKLSLISHQHVKPLVLNLDNIFDMLPNVAWTSDGPLEVEEARKRQLQAQIDGTQFHVFSVDKFPKLLEYFIPEQVRVVDGARVRLGAYLGAGTTVMQTGNVNFNAGTEGPNMVEGRVSVGVFVGGNTDLGGGSSTMSSLYRDNTTYISIGRDCVIGANAGAGIPLGDECTIEAGLYVTAGTKVELLDRTNHRIGTVKARDLGGQSNLLFRRNSSTGQVEALQSDATVQLNKTLHVNR